MSDYSSQLDIFLELPYQPVGIRFLYNEQEYAASEVPEAHSPLPYCKAVKNAGAGKGCKLTLAHVACLAGARAVGLLKPSDDICPENDIISGRRLERLGLHADLCVARQMAKNMVYCSHAVHGVEVSPLCLHPHTPPHVVILLCTPQTAMRVIQGHSYHFGQLQAVNLGGNQAICQECTSYVFEKNQMNISMLCAGTRRVAQWKPEELAVGIPYNKLGQIIDGIRQTADPVESNSAKARIKTKAKEYGVEESVALEMNKNYFTGGYGTVEFHKKRMGRKASAKPSANQLSNANQLS